MAANAITEDIVGALFLDSPTELIENLRNDLLKKTSLYTSKVKVGPEYPRNVGASITTYALKSANYIYDAEWTPVTDKDCNDVSAPPPPVLSPTAGYEEDTIQGEEIWVKSVAVYLDKLDLKLNPEKEVSKIMSEFTRNTAYIQEEYVKHNLIHNSENKVLSLVSPDLLDGDTCGCYNKTCIPDIRNTGWQFGIRTNGTIDSRYVYVAVPAYEFPRISELTLDTLEQAAVTLSYLDSSQPFLEEGSSMLNVIIPDHSITLRFEEYENITTANSIAYGGAYDRLARNYGVQKTFRGKYAVQYDKFAWRGYPDDTYNASIADPFDPNDPATWPRLKRIHPYYEVPINNGEGIKAIPDPAYQRAPFAISVLWNSDVITVRPGFKNRSMGGATLGTPEFNYNGSIHWWNEATDSNPNREKGFWQARFWNAIERNYPDRGFVYLHRLDHRVSLYTNTCAVPTAPCRQKLSNFCWTGLIEGDAELNGQVGSNRGAGYHGFGWG